VTPFQPDNTLDEAALRRLVKAQLAAGIDYLIPCGTTGESPSLSAREHVRVIEIVLEESAGRVPVIAGAGGNNTEHVREQIRSLERLGVDGILSVSPYYNKPTQEGIYQHYATLASSTSLPILIYNVPGRTGSNVEPRTLLRLAANPNIIGVKEASGNAVQVDEILRLLPERFRVISGDDPLTLPYMALGACGVISVVSNVAPREIAEMVSLCLAGDFQGARAIHRRLGPLVQALFVESNPIPVKAALAMMGMIHPVYRLPLVPPQPATVEKLENVLHTLGLAGKEHDYVARGAH